jgi:hypothetical protein
MIMRRSIIPSPGPDEKRRLEAAAEIQAPIAAIAIMLAVDRGKDLRPPELNSDPRNSILEA